MIFNDHVDIDKENSEQQSTFRVSETKETQHSERDSFTGTQDSEPGTCSSQSTEESW
jgi:hypothetical protein